MDWEFSKPTWIIPCSFTGDAEKIINAITQALTAALNKLSLNISVNWTFQLARKKKELCECYVTIC